LIRGDPPGPPKRREVAGTGTAPRRRLHPTKLLARGDPFAPLRFVAFLIRGDAGSGGSLARGTLRRARPVFLM
jgi:hypothetical protein